MVMATGTDEQSSTRPAEAGATDLTRRATRRRLWVVGGPALGILLVALGAVMTSNANFAEQNVRRQLAEQRITFKPAAELNPEERATPCLVKYAGQALVTGQQAECYANQFIGKHLKSVADGKTYSEMRGAQTSLRDRIAQVQASADPALPDLQRQLAEVNGKRQALFEGESLRGLLLTSYGFATLGTKAEQAATVAYLAGGAVLLLSLLVLVRGSRGEAR